MHNFFNEMKDMFEWDIVEYLETKIGGEKIPTDVTVDERRK